MDGMNRTRIVYSKAEQPAALALDLVNRLVYWVDLYLDYVGVVDYQGKNRHTLVQGRQVKHLYGITVFEDYLYAISSDNFNIIRINRFNGTDIHSIIKVENARGIRTYQKRTQPTVRSHACEVDAYGLPGGCSHICLLSSSYKTQTCRCRTGFNLGSDGRSCKNVHSPAGCTGNEFQCRPDGNCIPDLWRCDGEKDCEDGSDEKGCNGTVRLCDHKTKFSCRSAGRCINNAWVCDRDVDCEDQSDEEDCDSFLCGPPKYPCANDTSVCLQPEKLCNGRRDCPDGSDEGDLCDECSLNNGGCSNHCSVVPGRGIVCSCPEGHQLKKDNRTCEIVDYCASHQRCSQVCGQHKHMVKCSCYEGWTLGTDGESCTSVVVYMMDYIDRIFMLNHSWISVRNPTGPWWMAIPAEESADWKNHNPRARSPHQICVCAWEGLRYCPLREQSK